MRWQWRGSPNLAALPASPLLHLALLSLPPEFPFLSLDSSLAALGFPGSVLSLHQAVLSLCSASVSLSLVSLSSLPLCVRHWLCLFASSLHVFLFSPGLFLAVPVFLKCLFFLVSLFSTPTHTHTHVRACKHTGTYADRRAGTDTHMWTQTHM